MIVVDVTMLKFILRKALKFSCVEDRHMLEALLSQTVDHMSSSKRKPIIALGSESSDVRLFR